MTTPFGEALLSACRAADRILLTGPMHPDGDSIGACLALARGLRAVCSTPVDIAGDIPFRYVWMDGADDILPDAQIAPRYDLAVVLDGDRTRLEPPVQAAYDRAAVKVIIDHHSSTTPDGYDLVAIDNHAASTCELIEALLAGWGVPLDAALAALLYTGLIFDTGGFRHSNTTAETHRLAARLLDTGLVHTPISIRVLVERRPQGLRLLGRVLEGVSFHADGQVALGTISDQDFRTLGCNYGDVEGIVDTMVFTCGVELACLCVEKQPGRIKLSLRSRARVDVAHLARSLSPGGGGHPRAAGVILDAPLDSVRALLAERLPAALGIRAVS